MKIFRKLTAAAVILAITALTACGNQQAPAQEPAAAEESAQAQETAADAATESAAAENSETLTVVAVSKSIGDLWLLSGGELAGMTEDGMDLEGISENTEVIGTVTNPSLEAIAALSPDMVLLSGELPTHKKLAEELESRGISPRMISVNSFSDYDGVIKEFTEMTGREDCYKKNVTDVKERIDQILQSASEKELKKGTYLALRVSATKNKALKDDYFACEIFNAFAEAQESFAEAFSGKPVWQELAAVRNGCVYMLPKDYFQYKPNARWDEAYQYVMELLEE